MFRSSVTVLISQQKNYSTTKMVFERSLGSLLILFLSTMASQENSEDSSSLNSQNIALAVAAAAALFYTISSIDVGTGTSMIPAAAQLSNQWINIAILLFAMLTLSMLVADPPESETATSSSSASQPQMRHGERILPNGEVAERQRRRGASIIWADE